MWEKFFLIFSVYMRKKNKIGIFSDLHGGSVSDPYSFFTDPDPDPVDPDGGQYGSGSNTDPGL
jgi:hypothetical protein